MKKIILISLGVIVLVIAGLGVYVSMMDWNQHKDRLSTQISEILGKKVEFSGNLSVSYALHPKISAQDVNIINPQNNEKLAKISQLETEVTILSLIKGTPEVQSVYLVDSEFWLTLDEDNKSNWHQQTQADDLGSNEFLMQTINIVNSTLHFKSLKYNVDYDLNSLNAEIRAETIEGPYRLDGNFMKGNERYGIAFSVDALSQIDDINTTFVIMHSGSESYVRYEGSFNANSDAVKGSVRGDFKRTGDFINAVAGKEILSAQYNQPLQFSTDVSSDSKQIALSHFSVVFAQFVTGSGEIIIPKDSTAEEPKPITVKYQLRDMDFRPLATLIGSYFEKSRQGEKFEPNWHYNIDYDVSAVKVIVSDQPDGVFENVSIKGSVSENSFSVDDFYAGCAGNIVMNMTGNVSLQEGVPLCSANIVADGRNFLAMAKSLGYKLEAPSQSAYQSGKITAGIKVTPENISIEDLNSTLDKAKLRMNANISLRDNSCDINVEADKLNFDNYIFPLKDDETGNIKSIIIKDLNNLANLGKQKINLQANVGEAIFRGVNIKNLRIDAVYADSALNINNLSASDVLESSGSVSAEVKNMAGTKPKFEKVTFNIQSQNLMPLIKKWKLSLPEWPLFENKKVEAEGELSGGLDEFILKSTILSDGDSFEYDGKIQLTNNMFRFDGNALAKASRLDQFLSKFGVKITDKAYRVVFNGKTSARGNSSDFILESTEFLIGSSQYTGNTTWKRSNGRYFVSGNVDVSDFNLEQVLKVKELKNQVAANNTSNDTFLIKPELSKEPIDYSAYRKVDTDIVLTAKRAFYKSFSMNDLKVRVINAQGSLMLQNLSAALGGGVSVIGNTKLEYVKEPKIKGVLTWNNLKLDDFGGSTYAISANDAKINLSFDSSAQSFDSLLSTLSGTAEVRAEGLKFKGIDLRAIEVDLRVREYSTGLFQTVNDNLQTGVTEFNPLDANVVLKDGVITLEGISLRNDYSNTTLSGSVNLKNWRINTSFDVRYLTLQNIPPYSFSLSGALNKPIVDVSIGDIARKYDAHWNQIAQEEKAQKDKIEQEFADRVGQIKKRLINLSGRISGVSDIADNYDKQEITASSRNKYEVKKKRLAEMLDDIRIMQARIGDDEAQNDDLIEVESQMQVLKQEIDIISDELKSYYITDIRTNLDSIMSEIEEEKNRCDQLASEANTIMGDGRSELEKIQALQYLNDNAEINLMQTNIITSVNTSNSIVDSFKEKYERVSAMPDGPEKATEVMALRETYPQLKGRCDEILQSKQNIQELINKLVRERTEIYEKARLEAEKKRKAEEAEDAGNLLAESRKEPAEEIVPAPAITPVASDGNKQSVSSAETEQLPDAPVSEPTVQPTVVTPQPIVSPTPNRFSGTIIRSYDSKVKAEPQKKTSTGILKPVDGAVQKPSGTIIVK